MVLRFGRLRRKKASLLRLTAFILAIPWLLGLYRVLSYGFGTKRDWPPVDYGHPPPISSAWQESLRLNELLAHLHYSCRNLMSIDDSFSLCLDMLYKGPHGLFSGSNPQVRMFSVLNSFDSRQLEHVFFEKFANRFTLSATLLAADYEKNTKELPNSRNVTKLRGLLVSQLSPKTSHSPVPWTAQSLKSLIGSPDIVKIDCAQSKQRNEMPQVVEQMIDQGFLSNTKQFHLVIRIPNIDQNDAETLIYGWYIVVHRLFYEQNLVLYNAQQSGLCGRIVKNCKYLLSFLKPPPGGKVHVLAPIMGMGSPTEEYGRLFSHLNLANDSTSDPTSSKNCPEIGTIYTLHPEYAKLWIWPVRFVWYFCLSTLIANKQVDNLCRIYVFQISTAPSVERVREEILNTFPNEGCQVYLFDPELKLEGGAEKIVYPQRYWHLEKMSLAPGALETTAPGIETGTNWRLMPLENIMKSLGHDWAQALVLDLQGAEWHAMEHLLTSGVLTKFAQITARLSLWFGEENENYRQYFSWLIRMRQQGLKLFFSRRLRMSKDRAEDCPHAGCIEVGWVNERFK